VAIWMRARGRSSNSSSQTDDGPHLFGQRPGNSTGGSARSRALSVEGLVSSRGYKSRRTAEPTVEGIGAQPLP